MGMIIGIIVGVLVLGGGIWLALWGGRKTLASL